MTPVADPVRGVVRVVRVERDLTWRALDAGEVVGSAHAQQRPDRRWHLAIDTWRADVHRTLLQAVIDDVRDDLYSTVDEADEVALHEWSDSGFTVHRRETTYVLPTDPDVTGLREAMPPSGIDIVSAIAVPDEQLRHLDELLRQDVPGSDGWINDPQEFREYTFDPRHFDRETYLVAVDQFTGVLLGLGRIWMGPHMPRLGLIGVVGGQRRRGLARALLGAALLALHHRGVREIAAEADATNAASTTLLGRLGARRTGGTVELIRRRVQP